MGACRCSLLLRLGDLTPSEMDGRCVPSAAFGDALVGTRRALRVRIAGEERLIAAEDPGLTKERRADLLAFAAWQPPDFPISARDVLALGIPPGPRVGRLLDELRRWWEASNFAADRAACLARLDEIAAAAPSQ